jgi:FlaA1/EpsC-like NDP-sugar epimerase
MGEPIKIAELARNLITMAGYVPDEEIEIVYSGLRPGEKLHEELLTEDEERTHVMRDRIMAADSPLPPIDLAHRLADLARLAEVGDKAGILRTFRAIVPTYRHTPNAPAEHAAPAATLPPSAIVATGLRVVRDVASYPAPTR